MAAKAALKAAREALGQKEPAVAITHCNAALEAEPGNYMALVLLGKANADLGNTEGAEGAYRRAIESDAAQLLAWQGLASLFATTGVLAQQLEVWGVLRTMYLAQGDAAKHDDVLSKIVEASATAETSGATRREAATALQAALADDAEDASFRSNEALYLRVVALLEADEAAQISKTVDSERRSLRNTSKPAEILQRVTLQMHASSGVDDAYAFAIAKTHSDRLQSALAHRQLSRLALLTGNEARDLYARLLPICIYLLSLPGASAEISSFVAAHQFFTSPAPIAGAESLPDDHPAALFSSAIACIPAGKQMDAVDLLRSLAVQTRTAASNYGLDTRLRERALSLALVDALLHRWRGADVGMTSSTAVKHAEEALGLCTQLIEVDGADRAAHFGAGRALALLNRPLESLGHFPSDVAAASTTESTWIAWARFRLGELAEAERLLLQVIAAEPTNALAQYRLARARWQDEARRTRTDCLAHLLLAMQSDSSLGVNFTLLGKFYDVVESDATRASKCYIRALTLEPTDAEAGTALAALHTRNGDRAAAIAVYEKAAQDDPRAQWPWMPLGKTHLYGAGAAHSLARAQVCFQTAIRLGGHDDAACWEALGETYRRQGKYAAALKALQRAIELEPGSPHARFQTAMVRLKLGQYEDAIALLSDDTAAADAHKDAIPTVATKFALADCCFQASRQLRQDGRYGAAAARLVDALAALRVAIEGDSPRGHVAQWKLAGDVCLAFSSPLDAYAPRAANDDRVWLLSAAQRVSGDSSVPKELLSLPVENGADLEAVLATGVACYTACLALAATERQHLDALQDIASGLATLARSIVSRGGQGAAPILSLSVKVARACLKRDAHRVAAWGALGTALYLSGNVAGAQSAFVRATKYAAKGVADPWCNLGWLYMSIPDDKCSDASGDRSMNFLANRAFAAAQVHDPENARAWLGQALITERTTSASDTDALELYTHAASLCNAELAFANNSVGRLLLAHLMRTSSAPAFASQLPAALHLALKSTEMGGMSEASRAPLVLAGMLAERRGNHALASSLYERAGAAEHTGRALLAAGQVGRAVASLDAAAGAAGSAPATHQSHGLALYASGRMDEAVAALQKCGSSSAPLFASASLQLCQLLLALPSEAHQAHARALLRKIVADSTGDVAALLVLAAAASAAKDTESAAVAMSALHRLPAHAFSDAQYAQYASLCARAADAGGDRAAAKAHLSRAALRSPGRVSTWLPLSAYISQTSQSGEQTRLGVDAATSARAVAGSASTVDTSAVYRRLATALLYHGGGEERRAVQHSMRASPGDLDARLQLAFTLGAAVTRHVAAGDMVGAADASKRLEGCLMFVDGQSAAVAGSDSVQASRRQRALSRALIARLLLADAWSARASILNGHVDDDPLALYGRALNVANEVLSASALPAVQCAALVTIGRTYRRAGQLADALQSFARAADAVPVDSPDAAEAWQEVAATYESAGALGDAAAALERAGGSCARTADAGVIQARLSRLALMRDDRPAAASHAGAVLQRDSQSGVGRLMQAAGNLGGPGGVPKVIKSLAAARAAEAKLGALADHYEAAAYLSAGDREAAKRALGGSEERLQAVAAVVGI